MFRRAYCVAGGDRSSCGGRAGADTNAEVSTVPADSRQRHGRGLTHNPTRADAQRRHRCAGGRADAFGSGEERATAPSYDSL
jgi:hypothetical protein